jgi:7-cyano-7-deazaguanine synthase
MQKHAVVLLSGGMDSATCLAIANREGFVSHALSFRYGQRHMVELEAAARVANALGVAEHRIVTLDPAAFAGSALTGGPNVPKDRTDSEIGHGIPSTYVPARNTIFLAYALGIAETIGATDLFIGVNAVDYSGYPDCRPEYIAAFETMARLATKAGVEGRNPLTLHTPLLQLTKAEIVRQGVALGVDYSLTITCYDPSPAGLACGHCDACSLRKKGFAEAGVVDPTRYQTT